jgi:beta-glucanase (GH16 family)
MRRFTLLFIFLMPFIFSCGSCEKKNSTNTSENKVEVSPEALAFGASKESIVMEVTANAEWGIVNTLDWLKVSPTGGPVGTHEVSITAEANELLSERTGTILIKSGSFRLEVPVTQTFSNDLNITVPEGYTLVWSDEFNGTQIDKNNWEFEDWRPGYVNNELQRYVPGGEKGGVKTAFVENGALNIVARSLDGEVISARMNSVTGSGKRAWTYGWFEARILLPSGRGTWPAFWMMPTNQNYDSSSPNYNPWPDCGEIDIMEEVGYNPNYTSSSIHCKAYNHMIGTQKTKEVYTPNAEGAFHVYALEWTADYIQTYVDGQKLFYFPNDKKNNKDTWPFKTDFYLTLNLAWGGDWGGQKGVDPSALPATMQIDYVRVFQK